MHTSAHLINLIAPILLVGDIIVSLMSLIALLLAIIIQVQLERIRQQTLLKVYARNRRIDFIECCAPTVCVALDGELSTVGIVNGHLPCADCAWEEEERGGEDGVGELHF